MDYNFLDLRKRRTLFLGETNSGKTSLTTRLIEHAVASRCFAEDADKEGIVVIDFAPDAIISETGTGKVKLGGKLNLNGSLEKMVKYHYSSPEITAPRTKGRTREEVLALSRHNLRVCNLLLDAAEAKVSPASTAFINDVTIYFHAGRADRIADLSRRVETFIANGYRGVSLADDKGSGVSEREAKETDRLASSMDAVYMF